MSGGSEKKPVYYYAPSDGEDGGAKILDQLLEIAGVFQSAYHIEITINPYLMLDVIKMASRDLDKVRLLDKVNPNEYRQAGVWAVWIVRLKPIVTVTRTNANGAEDNEATTRELNCFVNEMFALFMGFSLILRDDLLTQRRFGTVDYCNAVDSEPFKNFLNILRYRVVSRHALELIFQVICEHGLHAASVHLKELTTDMSVPIDDVISTENLL